MSYFCIVIFELFLFLDGSYALHILPWKDYGRNARLSSRVHCFDESMTILPLLPIYYSLSIFLTCSLLQPNSVVVLIWASGIFWNKMRNNRNCRTEGVSRTFDFFLSVYFYLIQRTSKNVCSGNWFRKRRMRYWSGWRNEHYSRPWRNWYYSQR